MTTFSVPSSLLLALLLIVSIGSLSASSQSEDVLRRHVFSVDSLFASSSCSSSSANKAVGLKSKIQVIPRNGPCDRHSTSEENRDHAQLLRWDNERVASIQPKLSSGIIKGHDQSFVSGNVRLPAKSGASLGAGNYVVTIGLGTPKKDLTMIFDTGSDLTWTQCQPCAVSCYNQVDPIFNPSQSSSYKNVSCTSSTCSQIASGTSVPPGCSGPTCTYGVMYGDESYTYGFIATERLMLPPIDMIKNFQFGCGQNNGGIFGRVDGLIGLGRGSISLVEQTATKYGRNFSYCLPDTSSSTGYLSLGNNGVSSAVFTPMLTVSNPSFYGIGIDGIIVGGSQVPIPPIIFSRAAILDSGTVITRLPQTAYNESRNAFRQAMRNYTMAPPYSILDTCYDLSRNTNVSIPSVALILMGGVKVNLNANNILYSISRSQVCLAFAGNGDDTSVGIYGNRQQLKFRVIYDIPGSKIGFAPNGC